MRALGFYVKSKNPYSLFSFFVFRSLYDCDRAEHDSSPEMVEQLRKQLREKDLVLTDIRLEALSSAHQLESLKDTVIKMRVCNRF